MNLERDTHTHKLIRTAWLQKREQVASRRIHGSPANEFCSNSEGKMSEEEVVSKFGNNVMGKCAREKMLNNAATE